MYFLLNHTESGYGPVLRLVGGLAYASPPAASGAKVLKPEVHVAPQTAWIIWRRRRAKPRGLWRSDGAPSLLLKPHRPIGITPDPSGRATGFELRRDLNPQTARPLRRCEKLNGERRRGHGSSRSLDIQVSPYPWWG